MKFQFSLPKDEQFYNSYAQLAPTLRALGILAQIVSAGTEIGVIYTIIRASLADFLPQYANTAAIIGAVAATLFLELGLRQFLPHAARAILHRHYTGLHLPMTLFIWITCAVLLFASGALSFRGSREMIAAAAPRPTLADDAAAVAAYRQDSAATAERHTIAAQAIAERSRAEIAQQRQALARLQAKERAENRHYTTGKAAIREKIAAIEAQAAAELATLATARADDLATAQKRLHQGRDKVDTDNAQAKASAESKVKNYGLGLGWFSLLALFVLITAVALEEIANKGAGIEAKAQPNQWHFSQGIGAELMTAINGMYQHHARALIRRITDATPPPPPPTDPAPLWDIDPVLPRRRKPGQAPASPTPPPPPNKYAGIVEEAFTHTRQNGNGHHPHNFAQGMSAGQGITTATMAAPAAINQTTTTEPRRQIGYKTPDDNEMRYNAIRYRLADCRQCGRQFEAKTTWQKYCTEDCRLAYHAARHNGQKYDPAKKYTK